MCCMDARERGGGGSTVNSDDLRKLKFRLGCDSSSEPTFEGTLTAEIWRKETRSQQQTAKGTLNYCFMDLIELKYLFLNCFCVFLTFFFQKRRASTVSVLELLDIGVGSFFIFNECLLSLIFRNSANKKPTNKARQITIEDYMWVMEAILFFFKCHHKYRMPVFLLYSIDPSNMIEPSIEGKIQIADEEEENDFESDGDGSDSSVESGYESDSSVKVYEGYIYIVL